jgi:serine/threonine-protein kinase
MSPEQARGEVDVGASTDIWAFSVMLYETITGRRPFKGQNYNALILAIITQEPASLAELAACDAELWAIVKRGLAKDVAARWPTMRDLGAALAAWAIERGLREDAAGTALGSHWLPGGRVRTLSLHPSAAVQSPMAAAGPTAPAPAAPEGPPDLAVDTVTRPPFVPNRRPWLVALAGAALVAIGAAAYLSGRPHEEPMDVGAAPSATATAAPSPAEPPPSAPPPPPSASASASASSRRPPATPPPIFTSRGGPSTGQPSKGHAPPAPERIKF